MNNIGKVCAKKHALVHALITSVNERLQQAEGDELAFLSEHMANLCTANKAICAIWHEVNMAMTLHNADRAEERKRARGTHARVV